MSFLLAVDPTLPRQELGAECSEVHAANQRCLLSLQVTFSKEDVFVRAKDVLSIQHNAGMGSFLQCQPSTTSPFRTNYFSTNSSDWALGLPASSIGATWIHNTVCSLRVLYAKEQLVPIISPQNAGLAHPGLYTVRASVDNGIFSANLSCNFWVTSQVSGLRVVHPAPQGGKVYVPSDHITLVVKISSGMNATARWLGDNHTFPFEEACPLTIAPLTSDCARENNDTWFAVLSLSGLKEGASTHTLVAENAISSQNITITIKVEQPIRGLRATPDPESRVLLNTRVVSSYWCFYLIIFSLYC